MKFLPCNAELIEFLKFVIPRKLMIGSFTTKSIKSYKRRTADPWCELDMFDAKETHAYIVSLTGSPFWAQITYFFDPDTGESPALQFNYQITDDASPYSFQRYTSCWTRKPFPWYESWILSFIERSGDGTWGPRTRPIEKFNKIDEWSNSVNKLILELDMSKYDEQQ